MPGTSPTSVQPADVERMLLLCADASAREIPRRVAFNALSAAFMLGILLPVLPLGRVVLWLGALTLLWGATLLVGRAWAASLRNGPAARSFHDRLGLVNLALGVVWGVVYALPGAQHDLTDYRVGTTAVLVAVSIGTALRYMTLPKAWLMEVVAIWGVAAVAVLGAQDRFGLYMIGGGVTFALYVASQAERLRAVAIEGFQLRLRNESLVMELLGEQDQTREAWARVREQHATLTSVREQLVAAAGRDDLTGVHNRRRFMTEAEGAYAALKAGGGHFALVFVDLDHFEEVNERFGTETGDLALIALSRALKTTTRGTDAIGRLGGEEFALLLRGVNENDLPAVGERVSSVVRAARVPGQPDLVLTAAIGIASSRSADDLPTLLRLADQMMKQSRREGAALSHTYPVGAPAAGLVS